MTRVVENPLNLRPKELGAAVDGVPALSHSGADARRRRVDQNLTERVEVRLDSEAMRLNEEVELLGVVDGAEEDSDIFGA